MLIVASHLHSIQTVLIISKRWSLFLITKCTNIDFHAKKLCRTEWAYILVSRSAQFKWESSFLCFLPHFDNLNNLINKAKTYTDSLMFVCLFVFDIEPTKGKDWLYFYTVHSGWTSSQHKSLQFSSWSSLQISYHAHCFKLFDCFAVSTLCHWRDRVIKCFCFWESWQKSSRHYIPGPNFSLKAFFKIHPLLLGALPPVAYTVAH